MILFERTFGATTDQMGYRMSTPVIQKEVYEGIIAYRDGHYSATIDHLSSARTRIKKSGERSTEVTTFHTLLRLYWLKTLATNKVSTKSRRRLACIIIRTARIGSGYRRRALAICLFGRKRNARDDHKHLDRDLRTIAS